MSENSQPVTTVEEDKSASTGHAGLRTTARNKVRAINYKYAQPTIDVALVSTACKLLPLVHLIEAIKPHIATEPVFESRREKMHVQMALVLEQLKSERPKRKALTHAFKTLGDFTIESVREVKKEELKNSAKGFVVATIKNAPSLISAAKQAGLLS
ncbi:hypothetical protein [Hymenobacter tenuis]